MIRARVRGLFTASLGHVTGTVLIGAKKGTTRQHRVRSV
jgi:hypothetical protein